MSKMAFKRRLKVLEQKYLAVDLANKLTNALPYHGSISKFEAKRILMQIDNKLTNGQIDQILILAKCLGYIKFDNGGTTIRIGGERK